MTTLVADALRPAEAPRVAEAPVLGDAPLVADEPIAAEAAARRSLRAQIAHLESQLPPGAGERDRGARLLSLADLERIRDDLIRRIDERRFTGGEEQERSRRLREEMLLAPAAHFGTTVSNADVGEPGCTRWSSWFRLRISGGCP